MSVGVRIAAPIRKWHIELLRRLAELQPDRVFALDPGPPDDSTSRHRAEDLVRIDRLLGGRGSGLGRRCPPESIRPWRLSQPAAEAGPDLVLDLTAQPPAPQASLGSRTWTLRFDGDPGEAAALQALRAGRSPVVSIVDAHGTVVADGVPGSENPGVLSEAFDDLLAGCIVLIIGAVGSRQFSTPAYQDEPIGGSTSTTSSPAPNDAARELVRHAVRRGSSAALHRAYRALYRAPHWRVGWRWTDGPGLIQETGEPSNGWQELPDDGRHFYADPFPFEQDGRHYLFVEDFDHRVGRGVIAMTEFDDHGPIHPPIPVLSHDVHLSYPFVFAHDDEVWMIPETSAAGTIELYRATGFPHQWKREQILLDQVTGSDATVFRHQGRWWMTATVQHGGSFSDALHLWYADELTGPWTAHRHNPVLVDISSARPAGRVVIQDGRMMRPTQDGRKGYGASLTITEIVALDEDRFEQRLVRRLGPGPWWPGRRLHTLNRAGRLECIDGSAVSPRIPVPGHGTGRYVR
ncbi:MAG TPA: hypothetical protein VIP98_19700 [Microlunatus sp.]